MRDRTPTAGVPQPRTVCLTCIAQLDGLANTWGCDCDSRWLQYQKGIIEHQGQCLKAKVVVVKFAVV